MTLGVTPAVAQPRAGVWAGLAIAATILSCNGRVVFDASGCDQDSECPLASLHCDVGSASCVACTNDSHCLALGAGLNRCDFALHRCVECGVDSDCGAGRACRASRCVTPCEEEGNPPFCPTATPHCEAALGFCILCEEDNTACASLTAAGSMCNMLSGLCVSCLSDANCGGTNPRCDLVSGRCVECLSAADCSEGRPICDPTTTRCVVRTR